MASFTVSYLVNDWINIQVTAEDEQEAKEKAQKIVDKNGYKNTTIEIIDGNTKYIGVMNDDILDELNI